MIISPEAITYFIIGKKLGDKTLFRLAKYQEINVPNSLRKNISNSFLQKKQSQTTVNTIKDFVKEIVNDSQFSTEIDNFNLALLKSEWVKNQNFQYRLIVFALHRRLV